MTEIAELWVGEIPPQTLAGVEATLAVFGLSFAVTRKPHNPLFQIHSSSLLSAADRALLTSRLARHECPFELLHLGLDSERYSYLPNLGIHRVALNEVGEEILTRGQLELLFEQAGGSNRELRKLIDRATGAPWTSAIDLIREIEQLRVA